MRQILKGLAGIALLLTGACLSPGSAAACNAAQQDEIKALVKDYLVNNPAVLMEALQVVEKEEARLKELRRMEITDGIKNNPNAIFTGDKDADVVFVEFFDYNCGYCRKTFEDIKTLANEDKKVRFIMKDFPILGPQSLEASRVSLAVRMQADDRKLFDFHTKMMESNNLADGASAREIAKELGLDMARLEADFAKPELTAAIDESRELGRTLGLGGTPAFLIQGELIPGAIGIDAMKSLIANVRKCGKASCR
ncbi:MAG: DsbA family protein [Methylobacteriaceae bacterium]|jgi:protein-disulfide isomerase|nr:DsbA family protein [Methylobacteriaceae bacterium]